MCIFAHIYTHHMRTNINIDDKLMQTALDLSHHKTKKAIVEEALQLLIRIKKQLQIKALKGQLNWEGNLNEMRDNS